ncbi:MAG TPA: hypothetical protein VFR91_10155 [Dyella sp.]|nr:hypothetical protein [Dyella sp.]
MKMITISFVAMLLLSGCGQEKQPSALTAALDANEQIQLAEAEAGCGSQGEPQSLCSHLTAAQNSVDNAIYRIRHNNY